MSEVHDQSSFRAFPTTPRPSAERSGHSCRRGTAAAALSVAAVILAALSAGCESTPTSRRVAATGDAAFWPYWPASMRIHPLSQARTTDDASRGTLDLRLEFADADGVDTRAVGVLRLEATLRGRGPASQPGAQPESWTVDLANPTVNRRGFDTVTRTYHVSRDLAWPDAPVAGGTVEVVVTFDATDGRTMNARTTLRWGS